MQHQLSKITYFLFFAAWLCQMSKCSEWLDIFSAEVFWVWGEVKKLCELPKCLFAKQEAYTIVTLMWQVTSGQTATDGWELVLCLKSQTFNKLTDMS